MKILWTETALTDLQEIKAYISRDSLFYAVRLVEKLISSVESLEMFPEMGRKVPEANQENIREIIYRPYRIIYQFEKETVIIVTIIHSGRDLSQPGLQKWEIK